MSTNTFLFYRYVLLSSLRAELKRKVPSITVFEQLSTVCYGVRISERFQREHFMCYVLLLITFSFYVYII